MQTVGGRYRLQEQIGAGGSAPVWRAHDEVLDRTVAVKLLTSGRGRDRSEFERARNEARSAARLAHPNVAAVFDFGTTRRADQGAAFVVMELVDGPTLAEYLHSGPLNWRFAVRVCAEVSAGLAAAHREGIVHRDIKGTNVVLTETGAKILDFGIAARVGEDDETPDGLVLGTSAYMAPERLAGARVAPALDMFSLGVLFYRNLAGRLPWEAQTSEEMLHAMQVRPPLPLPKIAGLAPEAAAICLACLDRNPAARPTAIGAAMLLAASIDIQVYLPTLLKRSTPATTTTPIDLYGHDGETVPHRR